MRKILVYALAIGFTVVSWAEEIRLEACLAAALSGNRDLQARWADVQVQDRYAQLARLEGRPRVVATASARQHEIEQRIGLVARDLADAEFSRSLGQGSVLATMPVYSGGRLSAAMQRESLLARAASLDLALLRQEVALEVVETYASLRAQVVLQASIQGAIGAWEEQALVVAKLVEQEKAARVDVLRIEGRLTELRLRRLEATDGEQRLRERLNFLMGWDASRVWKVDTNVGFRVEADVSLEREGAAWREDERMASLNVDAAAALVEMERASRRPEVLLEAGLIGRAALDGAGAYDDRYLGVALQLSVWDGGRTREREALALARKRAATVRLESARATRRLEVSAARREVKAALERIVASEANYAFALETERIERLRYGNGRGTLSDSLDAASVLLAAEAGLAFANRDLQVACGRLDRALGLVFKPEATLPVLRVNYFGYEENE